MDNRLEVKVKRDNSLATFLADNATAYAGDTAFEAAHWGILPKDNLCRLVKPVYN